VALRAWTIAYFAPTIIAFQAHAFAQTVDEALRQRAQLWKTLNMIRQTGFTLLSLGLIPLNKQYFAGNQATPQ
jgi:hypothetical protein